MAVLNILWERTALVSAGFRIPDRPDRTNLGSTFTYINWYLDSMTTQRWWWTYQTSVTGISECIP